jgi:hypothetical protein
MTTKACQNLFVTLSLAAAVLPGVAQTSAPLQASATNATETPSLSTTERFIQSLKEPVPWLHLGGDLRIRNEYFNNALSLTTEPALSRLFAPVHEQDYFRIRGRVWAAIKPTDDLTFNVRLAAEPREFMKSSTMDTYFEHSGMQWRYGIVDNLNVKWKEPLQLPMTVTVGRQDIFLGDGWLVGDGTPEDGSFTTFLDSARITWDLKDQNTTIDAIGIVQDARPDGWLPTIGTSKGADVEPMLLTDQNEKGMIFWVANKSIPEANLDGYFIYKHDNRLNSAPIGSFGDNADIYTPGARVSGVIEQHWKYSVEGAYQFGKKQDPELTLVAPSAATTGFRDIDAFGLNSKLTYQFKDQYNNQLSLSYEYLTGDHPNTKNDEMFDVLWGRWPSWSEMYNIYSYVQETRVGQTANLHRVGPTWTVNPVKDLEFDASYFALFADQATPTRDLDSAFVQQGVFPPSFAGDSPFSSVHGTSGGNFRGHYLQSVLKYKFNRHVSVHLWAECLFPGDYYVSRGVVSFLRAEVMFTF